MPEYRRKKQYSGIKKPRNTNVPRWWQRYKDSNLKWRSQSLAIFFENRLFKPFFRLCVSQKSLRILFLLGTANSYEKLRTLHRGVKRNSKSALPFIVGHRIIWWQRIKEYKSLLFNWIQAECRSHIFYWNKVPINLDSEELKHS